MENINLIAIILKNLIIGINLLINKNKEEWIKKNAFLQTEVILILIVHNNKAAINKEVHLKQQIVVNSHSHLGINNHHKI
jgi:hypothetical protein